MILDAIKYEVGLAYNYLGWLGYFNKNNGRLLPYYPVKKLRGYEVNAGGSIFLQQVLEDIIELKPPKITKYLSADLNCLAEEIMAAYNNSKESNAIQEKERLEREAEGAR